MMTIDGYKLSENLYKGTRTEVYRGTRISDIKPVIVKVMRNKNPNFNQLVQFRNQYVITRNLEHRAIVQPLALERYGNGYALVMADDGAIALTDYWQESSRSLTEFLTIAMQLADALHYLTQERIVHKDIKPTNIVIHPETGKVQLIDFSISSLLPSEQQQLLNPNVLEGTLAYIAPEQTGRMNRGIDYRSDFYSVGATLYQLLTGVLPFPSEDPMELVHCHISQQPVPPAEVKNQKSTLEIPPVVSSMVMKLMAKNAEDRYQSALGLKFDLENCLKQWKEKGKIEPFELARRDMAGRFLIPEKLYGREAEVKTLLKVFDRVAAGQAEMMLVAGFSGIGKTAVVNEVHKPIARQRGYFIKGKFDQFNRNIPFSAFVQAFRDLMGQLLGESDASLLEWKGKILEAVGENGQVIIDVIPELERIIGAQPPAPELSGSAAQNRFNLLFEKFIAVFTTKEHPLTIFVDDLQWADSASLNLIKVLMGDSQTGYLLLLGAYRDNEVFPAHPLMLSLGELEKQQTMISTITLAPLSVGHINQLVAETLSCTVELVAPLTDLVYQNTRGNPFFTTQLLKGLHDDGLITFNQNLGYWECDKVKVRDAALTDDVVEFMAGRLHKLPEATQEVLKLAACIGNQFDLETLAIICETPSEEVAADLWNALREGLILPQSEAYKFFHSWKKDEEKAKGIAVDYRFLHDRVQQATYSLISAERKPITHLQIGKLLLNSTGMENIEDKIFEVVNQLNLGSDLLEKPSEKRQLAQLNFVAGKKAKTATAYAAASEYAEIARCLLPENHWQADYELAVYMYELEAETAYLNGEFTKSEALTNILLSEGKSVLDKVKAGKVKIQIAIAQNQLLEAIHMGRKLLSDLGIDLPENPDEMDVERALDKITTKLDGVSIESLIDLPPMREKKQLASMEILSGLLNAAYLGFPNLLPLIVAQQVDLSLTYGNMDVSPSAYANYGLILCGIVGDIDSGYSFGNLALNLLSKIESKEFSAKTIEVVCLSVKHWKEHVNATLVILIDGYKIGLESGDFESASFAVLDYCAHGLVSGKNLISLEREMLNFSRVIENYQQIMVLKISELHRQTVLNLIEKTDRPCLLKGKAYDEEQMLPIHQQDKDFSSLALFYIDKLFLCYQFGDRRQATEIGALAEYYLEGIPGQVFVPIFYLYDALSWLALYPHLEETEQKSAMLRILDHETRMAKWAEGAAMNYSHKLDLIQAEKQRVLGDKMSAMTGYDRAIAGAKENEYIQEEALANELAAKFYLDWGREKIAATYMQEAYYCYVRWGAKAKTDQLCEKYPQLLGPIFQKAEPLGNPTELLTSTQTLGTVTSTTSVLDLASAIKASQAISEEISLEALLSKLMPIVIENAGADKGALILESDGTWEIAAICANGNCHLETMPLNQTDNLPISIINTVKRRRQTLAIDNIEQDKTFTGDPYLIEEPPKSLCCTPIINQGKLIGILYLENNLTAGAFSKDRIEVLNLLTAQAAISIENARLYSRLEDYSHNLEVKVSQRTEELQQKNQHLQQTLRQLQQTQAQLIQAERMSGLGQMVAGIAHEINNPITFIAGNISHARTYVQDLLDLLALYEQDWTHPSEAILDKLEEIDLEFLRDDLEKMFGSMSYGSDRIREIVINLRNFSRLDESQMKSVDIHDGLENALMILQHRLQGNDERPSIAIVKNYGTLPPVNCNASQLNQVFLHIITNAIDALTDDGDRPQINITTQMLDSQTVRIAIADNGPGIPSGDLGRIFDPFFTRKPVGEGTGLGLSISYQIITDQHGGTIECQSQLGLGTTFTITLPISGIDRQL